MAGRAASIAGAPSSEGMSGGVAAPGAVDGDVLRLGDPLKRATSSTIASEVMASYPQLLMDDGGRCAPLDPFSVALDDVTRAPCRPSRPLASAEDGFVMGSPRQ